MIRMPLGEMVARIQQKAGLSEAEIYTKIDEKCKSLAGLISKEGAAHILANEFGVKLLENAGKLKDLFPGMRNIEVVGRVTQIFEVKEFVRADNSMGKVGSFVMGDDTGTARVVCWGNQADTLSKLTPGVPIKLSSGMVRENARGYKEIHLNESSKVVLNPVGVAIPEVKAAVPTRKTIRELTESEDQVEILGTIVQVFDLKFFEICPSCGVRLKELEGQWVCEEHNIVQPDYAYLLNLYLDDGTENMRIVLFRNQAERLLNKAREEILAFRTAPETFEPFKTKLLGEQFRFVGRAKHNTFFDRLEFIANQLFPVKELTT